MKQHRFAHADWEIFGFDWQVVLRRYGRELFRSRWAKGNVSGAIERSNRSRVIHEAEDWAVANGYTGLVWRE